MSLRDNLSELIRVRSNMDSTAMGEPPTTPEDERAWHDQACAFLRDHGQALVEAVADAERYRWLRDDKSNSLIISRNDGHASNYMTASEWIDCYPEMFGDVEPEHITAMRESGDIWEVHWYPDTPIGFYRVFRSTLNEAIDEAKAIALARTKAGAGGGA